MKDINSSYYWNFDSLPGGASLWPKMIGLLTGYGESHYNSIPDFFCPHIILKGKGWVVIDGKKNAVTAGDMFTLWPGHEFNYFEDKKSNWKFFWIHLIGDGSRNFVESCGFQENRMVFHPSDPQNVIRVMQEIHRLFHEKPSMGQFEVLSRLYSLPIYCHEDITVKQQKKRRIGEALTIIDNMLHRQINVNELCDLLGISRITLFRWFIREMNLTPIQYINGKRINKAKQLLLESQYNLATIARMSGFSNVKYFLKKFKMSEQMTPTEFRKNAKINPLNKEYRTRNIQLMK